MNCEEALHRISAAVDQEMAPDEQARLEGHLAECPGCRTTADAFRVQDEELHRTFEPRRQAVALLAERVIDSLAALPTDSGKPALPPAEAVKLRRLRLRLTVAMAAAAAFAGVALGLHALRPQSHFEAARLTEPSRVILKDDLAPDPIALGRLIPRPRPQAPAPEVVAVGDTVRTEAGQRRRVALPDGSVLYLNQNTTAKLEAARQVTLSGGEVFVEVAPREQGSEGATFVVKTANREVAALGTKFAVRADGGDTGVVVTQGKVQVSDPDLLVFAGQQLVPGSQKVAVAPRASHVLDWTRELMVAAESPLVPDSKYGGGALVAIDPYGQEAKLSLRKYHVDVHIEDGFARTTIDQTYFNHDPWRMEGTFYFPLPPDASLSRLAMYVEGTLMEGGMAERDHARTVFESIVTKQKDPALLEWVDGSTFKMRVFPLEGRQEKRIVLSYTQRLDSLYGQTRYRFPAGHNLDVIGDWSFHTRVKGGAPLAWSSDTHTLKASKDGTDLLLDAAARNVKADHDLALELRDAAAPTQDQARFSTAEHEGARYLMLRYRPTLPGQPARQRRDWVFLYESSGDRDPLLARVQVDVIRTLLNNAEHDDTFAILTAGTRIHAFAAEPRAATPENVRAAVEFLEQTHLIGALNLDRALAAATPLLRAGKNPYLVHVGSGLPALGERGSDVLAKRIPDGVRYVGVGVGKRWSRAFMKAAAEQSGGYFTQINPDEPVVWRAFELFATLSTPRLLDVKVVDDAERAPFLSYAGSLAQGEEVCAIARLRPGETKLPESVTISGTLDGRPFVRKVPVRDVAEHADYLPRTWAKLEIDRLLAEDAAKNKDAVVKLSKAMYVMTPFTSLLVLENEEMYAQYKVDRGRKDHWALYPCPAKISVVYEPIPGQPIDWRSVPKTAPAQPRPTTSQVLQTILVRVPPRFLTWPNQNYSGEQVATAANWYLMAGGSETFLGRLRGDRLARTMYGEAIDGFGLGSGITVDYDSYNLDLMSEITFSGPLDSTKAHGITNGSSARDPQGRIWSERGGANSPNLFLYFKQANPGSGNGSMGVGGGYFGNSPQFGLPYAVTFSPDGRSLAGGGAPQQWGFMPATEGLDPILIDQSGRRFQQDELARLASIRTWNVPLQDLQQEQGRMNFGSARIWNATSADMKELAAQGQRGWLNQYRFISPVPGKSNENALWEGDVLAVLDGERKVSGRPNTTLLYQRPMFSGDDRLFFDLVAYAPGMQTSRLDVLSVIEAEAALKSGDAPGHVDPAARTLIDKARTAGWQTIALPAADGKPALTLTFDGSGRFVHEHVLPSGLREQVLSDGKTLLHLYPELAIGARRTLSRFHRAEVASLVPWTLPPADDLARGADIKSIGEHTVAVVPRGAEAAKDVYTRIELVFAADGSLAERRVVAMPAAKLFYRETYAADGTVKVLDANGKALHVRKWTRSAAKAPNLNPDLSKLVVLPLPLRTFDQVRQSLKIDPNQGAAAYPNLAPDAALTLFAAAFGSHNYNEASQLFQLCFYPRNDRRLGFYTLLAALQTSVDTGAGTADVLVEHPNEPLARYLAFHSNPQRRQNYAESGNLGGPRDGFVQRLATFRSLNNRWLSGRAQAGMADEWKTALEFVRENRSSVLGWILLGTLQERIGGNEPAQRALGEVARLFDSSSPLGYVARYEHARSLLNLNRAPEARTLFVQLYDEVLKAGGLPPVDPSFYQALQNAGNETEQWTTVMRRAARLLKDKHRSAVIGLAWQCWQLGDRALADEFTALTLAGLSGPERLPRTLAVIEYFGQTGQYVRADALMQPLLADRDFARSPWLWRLAGTLAARRGAEAQAAPYLEKALEIEYAHLPDVINVQQVRSEYGTLLAHYQTLAQALTALKTPAPDDFLVRVVRAADRWRALDTDGTAACQAAARVLKALGAADLAWDYLTTPLALHPNEASPWLGLAQTLRQEGDLDQSDRAYVLAFEAEPANPHILWDRAINLQESGRTTEARCLFQQIADGKWQPRFNGLQEQARRYVDGR